MMLGVNTMTHLVASLNKEYAKLIMTALATAHVQVQTAIDMARAKVLLIAVTLKINAISLRKRTEAVQITVTAMEHQRVIKQLASVQANLNAVTVTITRAASKRPAQDVFMTVSAEATELARTLVRITDGVKEFRNAQAIQASIPAKLMRSCLMVSILIRIAAIPTTVKAAVRAVVHYSAKDYQNARALWTSLIVLLKVRS